MADDGEDVFGYRQEYTYEIVGVQVSEGKQDGTLQPCVVVRIRGEAGEPIRFSLSLDLAEGLADELKRWAARGREKHWE